MGCPPRGAHGGCVKAVPGNEARRSERYVGQINRSVLALLAACAWPVTSHATVYTVQLNNAQLGTVKQGDVPASNGPSGGNSCAPTATANAFAYLQNQYAGTYGSTLVAGGTYSDIQATATSLASSNFMSTTSSNGTNPPAWVSGEVNYLEAAAPGKTSYGGMGSSVDIGGINTTTYPWFNNNSDPTFAFLFSALQNGDGVELAMFPLIDGIGHVVTLTGLNWNDANSNGIIDFSEGATMTLVDPLDGTVKTNHIGQLVANGNLQTDYYHAGIDSGVIVMALSEVPVPEPASLAVFGLAAVAILVRRRRR